MIFSPSMLSTKKAKNSIVVRKRIALHQSYILTCFWNTVSRLYAHSKNYDMDLTLDHNTELFPLQVDQSFALALASSLARGGPGAGGIDGGTDETDDKDRDVWRPDGKGRRGLEEDYDYVMYGKAS